METPRRRGRYATRGTEDGGTGWSDERRRLRRDLGQNFLKDRREARRIVEWAGVEKDDVVLELGAGGGMLTSQLARAAGKVVAVEYDPFWAGRLKLRFSGEDHVRVVQGDALKIGFPGEPFVVVANVPFNITTGILHRLLDDPTHPPDRVHLLVQKQVALKHARSVPTTLKTLSWSPWYEFSAGPGLPSDAFDPKPDVEARLMSAVKRVRPLVEARHRHLFRALLRQAFEGNGRTVGRALHPVLTRTQLRRLAGDNGFTIGSIPTMLSVHQWAAIFGFMVRKVPRERWPSARRQGGRGRRRRRRESTGKTSGCDVGGWLHC